MRRPTMSSHTQTMTTSDDLSKQLAQIGLLATAASLDDFLARAPRPTSPRACCSRRWRAPSRSTRRSAARNADRPCLDTGGVVSSANALHAVDLPYKIVDRRYEHRSILLTTNLAFKDWNAVFPNATSIATLLDKLTHHADVTLIEGQSYRVHESQKEAAARRTGK